MPQRLLAAALTQVADTVGRIGESIARMETNQMHTNAHLSHMQKSLSEHGHSLSRIESRQYSFLNTSAQLTRIESSTDHTHSALLALISEHGTTLGKVESIQSRLDYEQAQEKSTAVRIVERIVDWGPKLLTNWAPISAAFVAAYKIGLPYLRQLLGF